MKTHLIIAILFACPFLSGLEAGDFDNWYFNYFSGQVTSSSKYETHNGNPVPNSEVTLLGKLSDDGKIFVQTAKYQNKIQGEKVEATLHWGRVDDGSFKGFYKDTNGFTVSYSLVLKDDHRFEMKSTAQNGAVMTSTGRIDEDGVMRSKDEMTAPDGKLNMSLATEVKQTPKPKVEQGGAGQPAAAPESKSAGKAKTKPESEVRPR